MGCTPRAAHPDQQGLCLTPRPARPLQLLSHQGLYNARPARPLENHPATLALHPQERGLPLRIQGQQVDGVTSWPSRGSEGSSAGNPTESPGPSRSPRLRPCAMMSPCYAPWAWACDEQDAAKLLLHCPLVLMTKKKTTRAKARHKKNARNESTQHLMQSACQISA